MNQTQFGEAMGVAPANVTNWKKRGMPPEHHERAAEVLKTTVDALLGRSVPAAPVPTPAGAVTLAPERSTAWALARLRSDVERVPADVRSRAIKLVSIYLEDDQDRPETAQAICAMLTPPPSGKRVPA